MSGMRRVHPHAAQAGVEAVTLNRTIIDAAGLARWHLRIASNFALKDTEPQRDAVSVMYS